MENADFVDPFWGVITKLDYFLGVFLCIYRSFLRSMYRTVINYFCGLPICCCCFFFCFFFVFVFFVCFFFFFGGGVNIRSLV